MEEMFGSPQVGNVRSPFDRCCNQTEINENGWTEIEHFRVHRA